MNQSLKQLQELPGVGKSIAGDLYGLGIRSIDDLKGRDPEELYEQLCEQQGVHVDRCVLYVFRCIVNFAECDGQCDTQETKWWNWKDTSVRGR